MALLTSTLPCSICSTKRKLQRIRWVEPSALQGQKQKYKDSFTDLVFINGCRQAFGRVAGWQGFPKVPNWYRKLFSYSGAELNARITPLFFSWLVDPCEIEKCQYLETSECTGLCRNSCKMPTQYFFTPEVGMPSTMEPNFEDMSCLMIFGRMLLAFEQDEVFKQKCCCSTYPTSNRASENQLDMETL